jgi:glycosyltransferase involved in cell wall biosynthesis
MKRGWIRIVDVCAYFTYPPRSGGQSRVNNINMALSKYAHVEQFSFTPVLMRKKEISHAQAYNEVIECKPFFTFGVILLKFLGIRNYDFIIPSVFRFILPTRRLRQALGRADIVQVEHPWLVNWVKRFTGKPVVLVEHNVESVMQEDFFKDHALRKRIIASIRGIESAALKRADLVFAMTRDDLNLLVKEFRISSSRVALVPNGAQADKLPIQQNEKLRENARIHLGIPSGKPVVLFVGSNHPPNDEAVRFIEKILAPSVKSAIFLVVGGVRRNGRSGNIICAGVVDDISLCYYAADIAINPVNTGGGSSLKTFECLANGLPLVTTKCGARGSGLKKEDAIICPRDLFSENIAKLINDARLRERLAGRSRMLAVGNDWGKIARTALVHYRKLHK